MLYLSHHLFFFILTLSSLFLISTLLLCASNTSLILEWTYLPIPTKHLTFSIYFDTKAMLLATSVTIIAAFIFHFSTSYISADPSLPRFTIILLIFVLSIYILVFIPHIIFFLIGWDGLGLISFLLIIYYHTPTALGAGMFTALSNRIGDSLILLTISFLLNHSSWTLITLYQIGDRQYILFLITFAAITKSAQIPFSRWLPAAIAAPTPVSALVHSSTLVTAGVFLLIRTHTFFIHNKILLIFLLFIGSSTILISSTAARTESDLKKIIALSTLRQLGLIIATLALSLPTLAFFHLITHAYFKALLFICAGVIIHSCAHFQDIRKLSLISTQIPITTACFIISLLALCGAPYISGFYSKDLILEIIIFNPSNIFIILLFIVSTLLTTYYSSRLIFYILVFPTNSLPLHLTLDSNPKFHTSIILMASIATSSAALINWVFFFPTTHPHLTLTPKITPLLLIPISFIIVWLHHNQQEHSHLTSSAILAKTRSIWFLTPLSSQNLILTPITLSGDIVKSFEHGWLEILIRKNTINFFNSLFIFLFKPHLLTVNNQLFFFCFIILPFFLFY